MRLDPGREGTVRKESFSRPHVKSSPQKRAGRIGAWRCDAAPNNAFKAAPAYDL